MKVKMIVLSIISLLVLTSCTIPFITLVSSSDGQFVDHVLLFEPIDDSHSFNLLLEKNQKYEFKMELFSPDVELELIIDLYGPDGDGDGFDDLFTLGAGLLDNNEPQVSSVFGCALSGNYKVVLTGRVIENVNLHFAIYDRGECYDKDSLLYDVSGYYHTKSRQYSMDLMDDTEYTVILSRVNSSPNNGSWIDRPFLILHAFVTVQLYDEENRVFNLIRGIHLENVFGTDATTASFGLSFEGEYRLVVEIEGDYDTVNVMCVLKEGGDIGDGPENNPSEPEVNTTLPHQQLTISVPKWTFGVVFGVGMIFVLIAVVVSRERNMRKIIQ